MSDDVDWDAIGVLGRLQIEADERPRFYDVKSGPLHVLVRTAMAGGQQGRGQKILIGRRDYGTEDIQALSKQDDFPDEVDLSE